MKQFFFLSGLPRSGSTVLGAILSQNPDIFVSPTSVLMAAMAAAATSYVADPATKAAPVDDQLRRLLCGVMEGMYQHVEKPVVIDKNRGWPVHVDKLREILGQEPKIVCTVRPVVECLASFARLIQGDLASYIKWLMSPQGTLKGSWQTLKHGFENHRDNLLFVEYADLVNEPERQLARIYAFLGLAPYRHDFDNIENAVAERDEEAYGLPGLHTIRRKLKASEYNAKAVLGDKLFTLYRGGEFWNGKPEPVRDKQPIDLQLEAGLRGDFETGWRIAKKADRTDNRAMFNKGWYLLRQGKLLDGMNLMDRGRFEGIFGNVHPGTPRPIWDGQAKGRILLCCEGGMGDQICGVRFARDIAKRGCTVTVSCSPELMPLFKDISGVSAVVAHGAERFVYHDFWVPSMSAVTVLGYEYEDLAGWAYLSASSYKVPGTRRIGLKWSGNPRFEHEQYRCFQPDLLWGLDFGTADVFSLQKEFDESGLPRLNMDTWEETASSIASLDLVITSCTSIAHLAGALGVETWVIVPILSYYIWAPPGERSPWYDSVRLFRQEKHDDWTAPFAKIQRELDMKGRVAA